MSLQWRPSRRRRSRCSRTASVTMPSASTGAPRISGPCRRMVWSVPEKVGASMMIGSPTSTKALKASASACPEPLAIEDVLGGDLQALEQLVLVADQLAQRAVSLVVAVAEGGRRPRPSSPGRWPPPGPRTGKEPGSGWPVPNSYSASTTGRVGGRRGEAGAGRQQVVHGGAGVCIHGRQHTERGRRCHARRGEGSGRAVRDSGRRRSGVSTFLRTPRRYHSPVFSNWTSRTIPAASTVTRSCFLANGAAPFFWPYT